MKPPRLHVRRHAFAPSYDDRVPFGPRWLLTTARVLLMPSVKRMHQAHSRRLSPIECFDVATKTVLPLSHVLTFGRNNSAPFRLARFGSPWVSSAGEPPWPGYPRFISKGYPLGDAGKMLSNRCLQLPTLRLRAPAKYAQTFESARAGRVVSVAGDWQRLVLQPNLE